ncbi:OpgC domain-containing protein [Arthrobacter agilis]|uniref:OpgC domain-containing protein n=1 Tax=Arthrobacter agilis TaxID=37921 RepID=UPI002365D31E|nr:OpgC domain-containing protein [Arthrobacter agilis]WDF34084.1 OpgC domain-containing protein [Arthrobacter agilis]
MTPTAPARAAGALRALILLLVFVAALLAGGAPAHALTVGLPTTTVESDQPPVEDPTALAEGRYFGPELDWSADNARAYADRAGITPSFFSRPIGYPLDAAAERDLLDLARQDAPLGAVAVVSLEPSVPLTDLTADDAGRLADTLERLGNEFRTAFFVRFAPEMNGTWLSWGQQPDAYVDAFVEVADVVHERVPGAAMVWAPSYAAGYPFTEAYGAVEGLEAGRVSSLDTNGNGLIDSGDDPYAPYYPGDDAVDWVGLSMYHFGSYERGATTSADGTREYSGAIITSVVPEADKFADQLAGTYGIAPGAPRIDFAREYGADRDQRVLVQTAALYDPEDPGSATEAEIKGAWLDQLFDPALAAEYPEIGMIAWLEASRMEPEADGHTVDWGLTGDDTTTAALQDTLDAADVRLGPVTDVVHQADANRSTSQVWAPATPLTAMDWMVASVVGLFVLLLLAGLARAFRPQWRYPSEQDPRDLRIDLLRGWIITYVVVVHIELAGPWSFLARNVVGAITGAELFVMLSGVVMGMVYPIAIRRLGSAAALRGSLKRSVRLYLTALGVVIAVYLLSLVPFIDASVITTFTDRGTGGNGADAAGRVYDLYPNAARLFDYPPPGYAIRDLLLLNMGPWTFNIMGLFVVLTLAVPLLVELLRKKLWWVLLAASWALYAIDSVYHVRVVDAQFQDVFPLLTWQVIFVHGVVLGYYRRRIIDTLSRNWGKFLIGALLGVYALGLALLWLDATYRLQLPFIPRGFYEGLYDAGYVRVFLQPGRLIDLAFFVVAAHVILTCFWKPLHAVVGWLYIPLGQSSLYVFIVHVFFVLAVGNLPGLDRTSVWQGLLLHAVVTLVIWVMVKRKFLFSVIPN